MSGRVDVGGLTLVYEDLGEPGTCPLLMVHGFTGHRDDFVGVRDALSAGRRVLIPDLRGHGDSGRTGRPDDYTFDAAVGDLVGLLDRLEVERCDLLGHSMGGMLALRLVLEHPTRVRSLIAMNTAPEATAAMKTGGLEKGGRIALESGMQTLQEIIERGGRRRPDPILERWAARYWAHHRRRLLAMDPAAYAGFGRALAEEPSVTGRLAEIRVPALVLVGDADADFLPGAAQLESGLANGRRVTLASAGHHPHEESRDAWLAAVTSHLVDVAD